MGFPAKTPGGQFEPFPGLSKYSPFKDPSKRLTDIEETAIRTRQHAVYADIKKFKPGKKLKPGQPIGTIKKVFAKQFGEGKSQPVVLATEEGYWSKGKFTKHKGEWIPQGQGKMFFRKEHISARNMAENKFVKTTYSKKTKALYPALSKDQRWFKRMEKEWSKKKGRTPFDI